MVPIPLTLTGEYNPAGSGALAEVTIYLNGRPIVAVPARWNPEWYTDSEIVLAVTADLLTKLLVSADPNVESA